MTTQTVLVVDDEESMREFISVMLRRANISSEVASSGDEAVEKIGEGGQYAAVLTDLRMPGTRSGLDVLQHVMDVDPACQVIVMTAFATPETAISAIRDGAYDYLTKPFKVDEALLVVERAIEKFELLRENIYLKNLKSGGFDEFVGESPAMHAVFDMVQRVAKSKTTVLITGESGTGKELVARAIHTTSGLSEFVAINCGAIPENLIEAELFGYKKGAFTGAETDREGLFEAAQGGTLFLDEVGELPLGTQIRLLRALQEKKIRRVGDSKEVDVDVRIVAATNRDLKTEVDEGRFREDLFYRLNVIPIELPPVRDRGNDIRLLVEYFVNKFNEESHAGIEGVSKEAMQSLLSYEYPGNVRELQNIIERAITLERSDFVTLDSLPPHLAAQRTVGRFDHIVVPEGGLDLDALLSDLEKHVLFQALHMTDGNRTEAAKLLNISFRSIRYRLSKHETSDPEVES